MSAPTTPTELDADGRSPSIEKLLADHHVTWTFDPALPLDQVDVARSLANQARIDSPLVDEVVDRYTADYRRGHTFPPLLAHRTSSRAKKVVLLGGNHRYAAATAAGLATHPAYIVEAEPETAVALAYADNRTHGFPPSTAQRVRQAIHLIALGWTQQNAALAVGVPAPTVSTALKADEGRRRADQLGVRGFDELAAGAQVQLARIRSDDVFTEAVGLAVAARFSVAEATKLADRIKKARSDSTALEIIGAELKERRSEIQRGAGGQAKKQASTPYSRLNSALWGVLDTRPADVTVSVPNDDARKTLRRRIKDTVEQLVEIDRALGGRR